MKKAKKKKERLVIESTYVFEKILSLAGQAPWQAHYPNFMLDENNREYIDVDGELAFKAYKLGIEEGAVDPKEKETIHVRIYGSWDTYHMYYDPEDDSYELHTTQSLEQNKKTQSPKVERIASWTCHDYSTAVFIYESLMGHDANRRWKIVRIK